MIKSSKELEDKVFTSLKESCGQYLEDLEIKSLSATITAICLSEPDIKTIFYTEIAKVCVLIKTKVNNKINLIFKQMEELEDRASILDTPKNKDDKEN